MNKLFLAVLINILIVSCGIFRSDGNTSDSDKIYMALQGVDQVGIVDLDSGQMERIDISYEFEECSGLSINDCVETYSCHWMNMGSMSHCHGTTTHEPHFITIDEINNIWFITTINTGWVGSYNLNTNELVDTIIVGNMPALMVINKANQKLYVSRMMTMDGHTQSSTFIQEIDYDNNGMMVLADNHEIASPSPHSIAINSDGSEVYTATYEGDWLFKIMTQSNIIDETELENGYSQDKSYPLKRLKTIQAVSVDDSLIFLACEGGEWSATGATWETIPGQVQLWNTNNMTFIDSIHIGNFSRPWHIINALNTNRVYVALKGQSEGYDNTAGVSCISYDISKGQNILKLEWVTRSEEFALLHGIDISDDGSRLYVSGRMDGKLHILDAKDGDLMASIYVGPAISTKPSGIKYYSNSN